jgi:glycosyltransferase involved in cell wall biosynthesis
MGISAIVLTHNAAQTLEKTLASVRFCDEVIVIDDNSTDETVAIAKAKKATVYVRAVDGDFAAQRNFGLSKARGDWILFVDSDEVVSPILAKEIKSATVQVDVNGFYLKRQDILWGKPLRFGETAHVRLLRLARSAKGKWHRPIHEVWKVSGVVATLTTPLSHMPHQTVTEFLRDINSYSTINAEYLYNAGTRVSLWHIIAYPVAKFLINYVGKQGFRDGVPGSIIALMMSFHSFLTRAKLWQLQKQRG